MAFCIILFVRLLERLLRSVQEYGRIQNHVNRLR